RLRRRTDENDPFVQARLREIRPLAEEAVAGMDRVRSGSSRHVEDALDVEIALAWSRWPNAVHLVGVAHVQRLAVCIGVHRHGANTAQLAAGADHAHRDLAPVGDQNFLNREGFSHRCSSPYGQSSIAGRPESTPAPETGSYAPGRCRRTTSARWRAAHPPATRRVTRRAPAATSG